MTTQRSRFAGLRVASYARYSSELQRAASIEDQQRRCTEYVEREGGSIHSLLVFSDSATSGASLQRAGFERMMAAIRRREVDVIVTEDISRISRDLADSTALFRELEYLGVTLIGIADGVDTSGTGAKVAFTFRSLMGELYLEQLSDKTRRGLEGRARAGKATGGLPLGYASEPEHDADGRVIGHRVVVAPSAAAVVVRIFELYAAGDSYAAIARRFNTEGVLPPRANSRHRRKGWVASTIREVLRNEAYVGRWTWRRRQWRKIPGTNTRRPRERAPQDVLHLEFPERRIVPEELWAAVEQRRAAVHRKYAGMRRGGAPGQRTNYPLSGILVCGLCGAPMTIMAGTHAQYYRCGDNRKRGTCSNALAVREDVARRRILGALSEHFRKPAAVDFLRRRIAEHLGRAGRDASRVLDEHSKRLARTEERIRALVDYLANGDRSEYVTDAMRDLEVQARADKAAIAAIKAAAGKPVVLPTPDELVERALALETLLAGDPLRAREALRRLFVDGRVVLHPQPQGHYVAEGCFLPLVALSDAPEPAHADLTIAMRELLDPAGTAGKSSRRS